MEPDEGNGRIMTMAMRIGLAGIACVLVGIALSGCSGPAPTHETPGWDELIEEVHGQLATISPDLAPDPIDSVPDPVDPYAQLTRSSPNAVLSDLSDVVVGQCFLYPYDEDDELMDVVQVVPCTEPHYGEVYATGQFTQETYSDDFGMRVSAFCEKEFEGYVGIGYQFSELYFDYSYASQYGWDQGLRGWRCYAVEADYENTGSVEGTHR